MYDKERGLYIAHSENGALSILGKMANRHGLIAGATGTGVVGPRCGLRCPCFPAGRNRWDW